MKYIIILFSALTLISCNKDQKTVTDNSKSDSITIVQDSMQENTPQANIKVETFPFPAEIKECSCYFAKSRADFENENYIYADDAGKTAYMKLNGKRLAMNLISSSDMEEDDNLSKEIENSDYKITVKGKKLKNEEALLFEGTLTIEKPDGSKITMPIYGECGC